MSPISILSLNLAAKNMIKLQSKTTKSFISYTTQLRSAHNEQTYYASQSALYNQPLKTQVSNNAGGQIESSEMTFVKNSHNSHTSTSDEDDADFVPSVSSEDKVSGHGHSKI
ncbi:hypothetical protein DAPK24_046340 [Pichia kluyveri]|uniref:Uncharacterized protein n=1 Tax=Pichia kluyveri TaxID=36015 RepID=A0AAV5R9T6_PICKL|nr:hypothetical protein DAPK24_046340 [Pichia kluyveri]